MSHFTHKRLKRKTRQELNEEGRRLKRMRKHKGKPSGYRNWVDTMGESGSTASILQDPRLGSKKRIPLLVDAKYESVLPTGSTPLAQVEHVDLMHELEMLENDQRLDTLLSRLEQNELLTEQEQHYVDEKLDRIEALMVLSNIDFDEE